MRKGNAEVVDVTAESPSHFPCSAPHPVCRCRGFYLIYRPKPVYITPNQFYWRLHADPNIPPLTESYVHQAESAQTNATAEINTKANEM
jgi:hypothetical protein